MSASMSSEIAAQSLRYTRSGVADGIREGVPLAISVVPWGLAFGIAAQAVLTSLQGILLSAYVFSGTAQFVALDMWQQPIAIPSLLLAVFAVNARYLLQGMTLAPWLMPIPPWKRWATLFFLSDASWAASLKRLEDGYDDVGHLLGTCVIVYVAWVLSSCVGLALPLQHVDSRAWGLDFAVSAAVIALAGGRWAGARSLVPWFIAALTAIFCYRWLGGSWYMFVGGAAGALAGAYRDGRNDR